MFERVVIIDIDGLRRDVYEEALEAGALPHIGRLMGTADRATAVHIPALSVAPSITFAAQASIFTGEHPRRTLIPGNDHFDRLGIPDIDDGRPRHYGFSVGDTKAYDDAVLVFTADLADRALNPEVSTIYESAQGKTSLVANNMYARGATHVIHPNLVDIARFTKGKGIFGMADGEYDAKMLDRLEAKLGELGQLPDIITAYFMGLDHHSHVVGPHDQRPYLRDYIDPQIGRLLDTLAGYGPLDQTLFVLISDHGQVATPGDDAHSIRLGFPFDMELRPLFEALGLDLHDVPGEDPAVDAVVGLNGGFAHVYLRHPEKDWDAFPRYEDDMLRVADAFHEMNDTGAYREELQGTLELILVRNAEAGSDWGAGYTVHLSDGSIQPFEAWLAENDHLPYADAANRIRLQASHMSGDIILGAKAADGVYFGAEGLQGVHGSLHRGDSEAVLSFAVPGADGVDDLRSTVEGLIDERCTAEGGREPSIADMAYVLRRLFL